MATRVGEEFEGFILSVHPFGFFAELREYFIEGLVKIESLPGDLYRFHEKKQILKENLRRLLTPILRRKGVKV